MAILGRPAEVVYSPLPQDDPRRRRPNIERARALLGWEPTTPLEDGLRATIEWFAGELREYADGELRLLPSADEGIRRLRSVAGKSRIVRKTKPAGHSAVG